VVSFRIVAHNFSGRTAEAGIGGTMVAQIGCAVFKLFNIDVIVGQNAQWGAIEIIILVRPQRPHESKETSQAEQKGHRHEINQYIHGTHST
jgi:hypothetical protein